MDQQVRHPRLLALCRATVSLCATVALLVLLSITLSFLGFVAVLGTMLVLFVGDGGAFVVATSGAGLVVSGLAAFVLFGAARKLDRYLVRVASVPSPLERVKAQYVDGRIDERGLERGLEQVLATESRANGDGHPRRRSADHRRTTLSIRSSDSELVEETV